MLLHLCLDSLPQWILFRAYNVRFISRNASDYYFHPRLNPLNSFEITADSAALHELLMPAAYERITNYEIAIGVDFQLENLAIADPADYELRGNIVFRKGGNKAARFFIIGCVTDQSALCYRLINKRHSVNIIPSIVGWGRATGVIQELLGDVSAYIFRGGLSFSTMGENRPSK
jgi:hypothetical protein